MKGSVARRFALFGLGFISISTQIYLIREFISVFNGTELVFGIALANWMVLTAAGAWLGRYSVKVSGQFSFLVFLMLLLALLPTLMVVKLGFLRTLLFPYGSMVNVWQLFYSTLLIQIPFCLLNGYLFSAISIQGIKEGDKGFISSAYSMESWGSLAAGFVVNFFMLWFFDAFTALLITTSLFLVSLVLFTWQPGRRISSLATAILAILIISALSVPDFSSMTERLLYPDQRVIANDGTPYGQVVVTENEKQLNFYENGMLLFSSGNVISDEENVHFAMVQHPEPRNVLLVSGGLSGALTEILKYKPSRVDYVELNPSLISLSRRFIPTREDPVVRTHITDGRKFIRTEKGVFDVVLMNLPEPSTLQVNRFYTAEFFLEVRSKMNEKSVLSVSLPTTSDYVSKQAGKLNSGIFNTLKGVFRHVLVIPSGRNFFLASDSPLSADIPGLIAEKEIPTVYVNRYYLDSAQLKERSDYVMQNMDPSAPQNRDFRPVSTYDQLKYRLSYFGRISWFPGAMLVVVLVLIMLTLNPVSAGLFTGGFAGASIEVILLLSLQIMFGSLFQVAGIVITIFMFGLAAGSGIRMKLARFNAKQEMLALQLLMAILSVVIPLLMILFFRSGSPGWLIQVSAGLMMFLVAFIAGREYSLASLLTKNKPGLAVSGNYSAELAGSATGALVVTLYLIPVAGFPLTGLLIALLNVSSAVLLLLRGKNTLPLQQQ